MNHEKYKELLVHFLNELIDLQGNAGCNDFDLSKFVPKVNDRRELMKKFHQLNGDPEEYDDTRDYKIVSDSQIVFVLIKYFS